MKTRFRLLALTLLIALLATTPGAAQKVAALPSDKVKQIEAIITAEMSKQKIPGFSIAVVMSRQPPTCMV